MEKSINSSGNRNYGIDLLRVVAMFYVLVLHCIGNGGLLEAVKSNNTNYNLVWGMEIFSYCAVNVFALISGYVSYNGKEKKFKISNYLKLWLEVVFYGVMITAIFHALGVNRFYKMDYYKALFPVINAQYWYFTAYTGLFFIKPFLDKAILLMDEKLLKKLFIVFIVLFSMFDMVFDRFVLKAGYSVIWLVILYILGAIIKKCNVFSKIKIWQAILIQVIMLLITFIYQIISFKISFLNVNITTLASYTSPTILIVSIMYIIVFSKLRFKKCIEKIIAFMASSAFAIYIIHVQGFILDNLINNKFAFLATESPIKAVLWIYGFSIIFVICVIPIDKFRKLLFKIIKVDIILEKINILLSKCSNKIIKILQ